MTGKHPRNVKNPAWLGLVRHSYEELFRLVFCGVTSVGLLALLASLRIHPFVELQGEVVKHLVSLPLGLVLLAMFATAIPIVLVNVLASIVRVLAAQQLTLLAFHMSCLWFGAQITTQFLGIDFRANDWYDALGKAFDLLRCNFTVVAVSLGAAAIGKGALEEHSSGPARLLQTVVALLVMWLFYELLVSEGAMTKSGLVLASNPTTKLWGTISFVAFVVMGIASLQDVTNKEEFEFEMTQPVDDTKAKLADPTTIARLLYPDSSKRVHTEPAAASPTTLHYISVNSKKVGDLTLVHIQTRKVTWRYAAKNGATFDLTFTISGKGKNGSKLETTIQSSYDKRIWKRFVQTLNGPSGLLTAQITLHNTFGVT